MGKGADRWPVSTNKLIRASEAIAGVMLRMQSVDFLGQVPFSHPRQLKCPARSTRQWGPTGHQRAASVGPMKDTVGTFRAAAICSGP